MNPFKLLMIWACLVLAACGGGGSDSPPQAKPESVALELLVHLLELLRLVELLAAFLLFCGLQGL